MLLSNSRIEKKEKIIFYEQDILLDDHVYSGDIDITLAVDYVCPGIGIALVSNEGLSIKEDGETYLFRLGHSDYSIIRRLGDKSEVIENGPVMDIKPFKDNLIINIKKMYNRIQITVNGKVISKKLLPTEMNTYMIGYYSNAGNIINSINIASEIPAGWVVNMSNTDGGYVKFSNNKFTITNCSDKAEIEQVKIKLKATGNKQYHLKYELEDVEEKNDIKSYVFMSSDNRYDDEEKNILKDNSFYIKKDEEVSVKFTGTIGTVKNIQITDNKDDFYVPTDYEMSEINGSLIKIKIKDLLKVEWAGTIHSVPLADDSVFGIIRDKNKIYKPAECNVKTGKEAYYEYEMSISDISYLKITNKAEVTTKNIDIDGTVTIFENMDSVIDKLILYKKDGTKVDIIGQNTKKQYVPASIKSPIIVLDENEEPLDLSSSYRVYKANEKMKYEFTNVEREIFEPKNRIKFSKLPSTRLDTIVVYGIMKDSETRPQNIMTGSPNGMYSLSDYCDSYEVLRENDLYIIERNAGTIVLTDGDDNTIKSKYKELVVDYLKKDSYTVNYKHELSSYEIDISTTKGTKVQYDGIPHSDDIVNVNEYKTINTVISNNSYIVLRGR